MMKNFPNFFIVGAAKSGTTSLYEYLNQHPDIYMSPIKEPNYFAKDINPEDFREDYKKSIQLDFNEYFSKPKLERIHIAFVTNFDDYLQLFRERKKEKVAGEISNTYLYSKVAAKEIYKYNPNAKILMILRNPVERAFSHFVMNLSEGLVTYTNFLEEVLYDFNKEKKGWGISHLYIELGLYYEQVKRYYDIFNPNQVKVIIYEDYKKHPEKVLNEIFSFLEVPHYKVDLGKRFMVGNAPKNYYLNKTLKAINKKIGNAVPKKIKNKLLQLYKEKFTTRQRITEQEKKELLKIFEEDIKKLSKLINRDLSMWLE